MLHTLCCWSTCQLALQESGQCEQDCLYSILWLVRIHPSQHKPATEMLHHKNSLCQGIYYCYYYHYILMFQIHILHRVTWDRKSVHEWCTSNSLERDYHSTTIAYVTVLSWPMSQHYHSLCHCTIMAYVTALPQLMSLYYHGLCHSTTIDYVTLLLWSMSQHYYSLCHCTIMAYVTALP